MGKITDQVEGPDTPETVRCPFCAAAVASMQYCRHVRWTFDQGDPIDFARFALETSPYTTARRFSLRDVPKLWWDENVEWVVDLVMLHFEAADGYVFGELADLDLLARDFWKAVHPDPVRPQMARVDPV